MEKGEKFESNLEEVTLPINLNDLYIFYSDGINEAMNEDDELYGIERLLELTRDYNYEVTADEMLKRILDSIDKFRNSAKQNDDITLVLVKKV
jgi:sigma-B regulation protein RsbU (phosphoserine phosphatase)